MVRALVMTDDEQLLCCQRIIIITGQEISYLILLEFSLQSIPPIRRIIITSYMIFLYLTIKSIYNITKKIRNRVVYTIFDVLEYNLYYAMYRNKHK